MLSGGGIWFGGEFICDLFGSFVSCSLNRRKNWWRWSGEQNKRLDVDVGLYIYYVFHY